MEIAALKDRLGDQYDALAAHIETLVGQRDAARKESIDGRRALKAENEALKAVKVKLFEKLGLDDDADLDALPDPKGQAEAVKQFESRVKRLEKDLADAAKARDESERRYRDSAAKHELRKAMAGHQFVDDDLVAEHLLSRVAWDGEKLIYRHGETPVALDEGVKLLAQARPGLLKQPSAGGSGWNPAANSNGASVPAAEISRQKLRDRAAGKPQSSA